MLNKLAAIIGICFFCGWAAGCSTKGIYYFPNKELYRDPKDAGLAYDMVRFPSANGKQLFGLYFKAEGRPAKGVIIHFHGNFGNVSHHFGQSTFLLKYGFDVLLFDYQGYGASEGKPTPKATVQDGLAAIRYLKVSTGSANLPIGLFGQSIGAAVAAVVAAEDASAKAVVLEAGFSSYKAIVKDVMKRGWPLRPFAYFLPWFIAQRGLDPVDYIGRISPRPVYIIHGDRDRIIPFWMGGELFAAAREPKKFWTVSDADHLECKVRQGEKYEREIAGFFEAALLGSPKDTSTATKEIPGSTLPARK